MARKTGERNLFFLYEQAHIDACTRFLDEHPEIRREGYLIVPSSLEIESALAEKSIPFCSGRAYRPRDTSRFQLAEAWTAGLFDSQEWRWFQYRGVSLAQMFFLPVQDYILRLLYYTTVFENVLTQHPAARRLVVFPSSHSLAAATPQEVTAVRQQPLLREHIVAVVACAKLIGKQLGIEVVIPHARVPMKQMRFNRRTFALKRMLLELSITMYNICIGLVRPRGTPRILASDYWRNVAPIMEQLPQGELMLFDRGEALKAGFKNLWRYRIRLYNFNSFSIRDNERARGEAQQLFEERRNELRENGFSKYAYRGITLRPLMIEAFDELCARVVPQTLRDIDGTFALLIALKPDIVFLRASVSLQTHFNILAQVARACAIPSLELQHGLEYLGPDSYSRRHSAEYIAVYGQLVQDEFAALGFPREKLPIVGSPRFDAYEEEVPPTNKNRQERKGLSVLCVGTIVAVESAQDDYDLEDYYTAIARALEKVPGSSVVIKLRPGPVREHFYREVIDRIFARIPHTITRHESLPVLFASADFVVSYYSTFVLEALKFNKPVVVFTTDPPEKKAVNFHFTRYSEAGGLLVADTQEDLENAFHSLSETAVRERLSERAENVLSQFHLFDGKASERIIELITRLSQKRK